MAQGTETMTVANFTTDAVATTMDRVRERPLTAESWSRPGEITFEDALRAWLEEYL